MRTFIYFIGFTLLVNYIGFEMIRQLEAGTEPTINVTPIELDGESLYTPEVYEIDDPEVQCLAENLFHEARGEGVEGKEAVAFVTINRVKHHNYGDAVCEVVHEPYQFSWTHQGMELNLDNPIERRSWEQSQQIALEVLNGERINDMIGITHYHATHVSPNWGKIQVARVGNHIFYSSE